jgi:hypothetical protein
MMIASASGKNSTVGNLVRLVDDDRFGVWQELDKALLFHRQVGKQQVVIDDHKIRFLRSTTRFDDVAARVFRTRLSKTAVDR